MLPEEQHVYPALCLQVISWMYSNCAKTWFLTHNPSPHHRSFTRHLTRHHRSCTGGCCKDAEIEKIKKECGLAEYRAKGGAPPFAADAPPWAAGGAKSSDAEATSGSSCKAEKDAIAVCKVRLEEYKKQTATEKAMVAKDEGGVPEADGECIDNPTMAPGNSYVKATYSNKVKTEECVLSLCHGLASNCALQV